MTKGLPFSPEKGGISPCEMPEGADVSDNADLSIAVQNAALQDASAPSVANATAPPQAEEPLKEHSIYIN